MNHIGILQVSFGVLHTFLKFPAEAKMLRVRQSWEQEQRGEFEILVESPALNGVLEGNKIPWIKATLTAEFCTQDEIVHLKDCKIENY